MTEYTINMMITESLKRGDAGELLAIPWELMNSEERKWYTYIDNFGKKYHEPPKLEIFRSEHPEFRPDNNDGAPLPFLYDKVARRLQQRFLYDEFTRIKTENGLEVVLSPEVFLGLAKKAELPDRGVIDYKTADRSDYFLDNDVIKFNVPFLKEAKPMRGEHVLWVSRMKSMKTFNLLLVVVDAIKQGYNVALISPELSLRNTLGRLDSFIGHIPYTKFRFTEDKESFKEEVNTKVISVLNNNKAFGELKILNIGNPRQIDATLNSLDTKFDILAVDSIHHMSTGATFADVTLNTKVVLQELGDIARAHNLLICSNTQLNRSAETGAITAGKIAGSDEYGRLVDLLVGLTKEEANGDTYSHWSTVVSRNIMPAPMILKWDWANMNVEYHAALENDTGDMSIEDLEKAIEKQIEEIKNGD